MRMQHSYIRILLMFLVSALGTPALHAQTADDMVKEGDQLVRNLKEEDAIQKYKDVLVIQPDNLPALIACSDLSSRIGNRQSDKNKQRDFFTQAQEYAQKALKVDSTSSDANCVMAIALGRLALTESAKKKVAYVRDIKSYCDRAIQLNRTSYRAYHVLGKWNYEVSNLNAFERAAARMLFGGLPDASVKEAIRCYEKCRSLNPNFLLNYLEMAKAYKDDDQNEKALSALQTLVHLPVQTEDDPGIKAEGRKMLDAMM